MSKLRKSYHLYFLVGFKSLRKAIAYSQRGAELSILYEPMSVTISQKGGFGCPMFLNRGGIAAVNT